jgi:hypothetical protein
MPEHKEIAEYTEFMGVDIKADNIVRDPSFASDGGQNIIFGGKGEINRLPGTVVQLDSQLALETTLQGISLMKFEGFNQTGSKVKKLLGFNNNEALVELSDEDFKVVYAGAGTPSIEVGGADGTASIILYVNNAAVYTNTTAATTVANLVIAINAVAGWTATATANVAYLRGFYRVKKQDIATAGFIVRVRTALVVPVGTVSGFSIDSTPAAAPTSTYAIPSHVCLNNVLYFTDFVGKLCKYDGHYVYQAGLKAPTLSTASAVVGTGYITPGQIFTIGARAKFVDYGGNTHYSKFTFSTSTVAAGQDAIACTVGLSSLGGSVDHFLTPSSNQVGVTTIATGATSGKFLVGDKCLIVAAATGTVQLRTITGVAANSIDVDASVTALTTDIITHQVSIEIWSSTNVLSGTQNEVGPFFFVQEVTVNPSGVTKIAYRFLSDATMTAASAVLTTIRTWATIGSLTTPFPAAKHLAKFQNALIFRDYTANNLVHFSDQDGQEQFDLAVNNFTVDGEISGIGGNKEFLAVFKDGNIDVLVGDLQGFSVRVDRVEDDIGCVSHPSIQKIDEGRLFFLSRKGPYQISSGNVTPIGPHITKSGKLVSRLEPFFTKNRGEDYTVAGIDQPYLALERAVGCVWTAKNTYIIHTPFESRQYPGYQYQEFSAAVQELSTWAFNWEKGIWYPVWNVNPDCGGFDINGEFSFLQRTTYLAGGSSFYYGRTQILSNTGTVKDFFTATGFNTAKYVSGWFHLGIPSTNKRFLRVRLFCHETVGNSTFTMDVKAEVNFQSGTYPTNIPGVSFTVGSEKKVKLTSQKARSLRISFEAGTVNENISINGIVIEWAGPYHCGFKE